jgi:hypothetical protein
MTLLKVLCKIIGTEHIDFSCGNVDLLTQIANSGCIRTDVNFTFEKMEPNEILCSMSKKEDATKKFQFIIVIMDGHAALKGYTEKGSTSTEGDYKLLKPQTDFDNIFLWNLSHNHHTNPQATYAKYFLEEDYDDAEFIYDMLCAIAKDKDNIDTLRRYIKALFFAIENMDNVENMAVKIYCGTFDRLVFLWESVTSLKLPMPEKVKIVVSRLLSRELVTSGTEPRQKMLNLAKAMELPPLTSEVVSLDDGHPGSLDLSKNDALQTIVVEKGNLASFRCPPNLTELTVGNSRIDTLDISQCVNLKLLVIYGYVGKISFPADCGSLLQVTTGCDSVIDVLDLSQCSSLKGLTLRGKISKIVWPTTVESLWSMRVSHLENVDLSRMAHLETLCVYEKAVNIQLPANLTYLALIGDKYKSWQKVCDVRNLDMSECKKLNYFKIENCSIKGDLILPPGNALAQIKIPRDVDIAGKLDLSKCNNVQSIKIFGKVDCLQLPDDLKDLTWLDIDDGTVGEIRRLNDQSTSGAELTKTLDLSECSNLYFRCPEEISNILPPCR